MKSRDSIRRSTERGSHTTMNGTQTGLVAGLILGTATAIEGFSGFCIALVIGLAGLVVGRVVDGDLDLGEFLGRGRDR